MNNTILVMAVFIYCLLVWGVVSSRCTSYKCRKDFSDVDERVRDATTKDVWVGLCWPILFLWLLVRCVMCVINELFVLILLLIGFKYKNTKMYKLINEWVNI